MSLPGAQGGFVGDPTTMARDNIADWSKYSSGQKFRTFNFMNFLSDPTDGTRHFQILSLPGMLYKNPHFKKACMQEGPRVEKCPIAIQFLTT